MNMYNFMFLFISCIPLYYFNYYNTVYVEIFEGFHFTKTSLQQTKILFAVKIFTKTIIHLGLFHVDYIPRVKFSR